ncbi:MAG: hypothetical protein COU29_03740 [Candidatus Magasanikbacteria bacterium CG10_big_fil_rev_8_21_14_0_10_36_32]|uniref:Uncharacterized protein n=1 Tax=Candidatus Magasanikbacteria bacterium CG10_big_fil_rev_8_21_14_0_10_36_32 TaxID=1974646 RepID=A0A2M6W5K9_9BACT|nr:MAG: hypothetical protein COU29_03740 [Candidatus Magasanikbacteria bacterium CG10_big_fil_rev_8_21_14_0_10_36_32]
MCGKRVVQILEEDFIKALVQGYEIDEDEAKQFLEELIRDGEIKRLPDGKTLEFNDHGCDGCKCNHGDDDDGCGGCGGC